MGQSEVDELDSWQEVETMFDQDHETNDKLGDNNLVSSEIISTDPSGSRPPFAIISDPLHTERSNAQAAGGTLHLATDSSQGHEHTVDGADDEVNIPEVPGSQTKRSSARANDESAKPKRARGPNWAEDEKNALLVLKLEALVTGTSTKGGNWSNYVSKHLLEKHGFDRASKSCQQQWDTLLKSFNAIRDHESKILSGTSTCVSFWKMDEHERSEPNAKLPQVFYFAWYVLMERIIQAAMAAKKTPPTKGTRSIQVGANLASSSTHIPPTITINSANLSQLGPGPASDAKRSPSSSQDIQVSTIPPQALFSNLATTQGSQQPEDEVLGMSGPYTQGSQQRPEDVEVLDMANDDLISRIAPFVNKQIEDRLEPLKCAWLSREEDEHRHREKILAIEKEKLALMREKMEFTHRGATSMGNNIAGTSTAHAQAGAALNLESTSLAQGGHIADDRHAEVKIMQADRSLT